MCRCLEQTDSGWTNNDFVVILLCRVVRRELTTWNYIMMYVWPSGNSANNAWANYFWSVRLIYLILHIRVKNEIEESWLPEIEQQKLCLNWWVFQLFTGNGRGGGAEPFFRSRDCSINLEEGFTLRCKIHYGGSDLQSPLVGVDRFRFDVYRHLPNEVLACF